MRFEEALILAGLPEDNLLRILAEMYRVQYISTAKLWAAVVDKRTLALIPAQIAEHRQVVPVLLDRQRSILSVVTADPDDIETMKELEIATQVRTIRALVARPAAVAAAVRKLYQGDDFAFSILNHESGDVASALDRDPLAMYQAHHRGDSSAPGHGSGSSPPAAPFGAPGTTGIPMIEREATFVATQHAGMRPSVPPPGAVAPRAHPVAPGQRASLPAPPVEAWPQPRRTPTAETAGTAPPRITETNPSAGGRRLALTPPPESSRPGEAPEDLSPLPMALSPALSRSAPPPRPSAAPLAPAASSTPPARQSLAAPTAADRLTPEPKAPAARAVDVIGESYQFALVMLSLLEGNRPDLRGHSIQTARLVSSVCARFNVPPLRIRAAEVAALIHDLGKASTYHLTPYNVARFDGHRAAAQKLYATPARVVEPAQLAKIAVSAVTHMYERYDGHGFPGSLKGNEIPLEARILAICDSYTDLTANPRNSFRKVLSPQEACEALRELQGAVFDPKVVDRFSRAVLGDDIAQKLRGDRGVVLLVDPDVEETTMLELALVEKQYDVHVARTLEEAMRFLESGDIHLVVSELELGAATGFHLLTKIKARPGGEAIPFMILSQEADANKVAEALDAGAADFLFKSLATQVIVAKVRRLLEQSQSARRGRGVSGSLEEMGLPDIVQILHQGRKTGALKLSSGGEEGAIYFKEGAIVDCAWRKLKGAEAFYALVGITKGEFMIDPSVVPPERVIDASPEMLLLEGMRRLDEASH